MRASVGAPCIIAIGLVVCVDSCGRIGFAPGDDDSPDGGDPSVCASGFDLCDGFEAPAIDTTLWSAEVTVTRDTAFAHRGTASLHMHLDTLPAGNRGESLLSETRTLVTSTPTFWVRGFFWLSALPAGTNGLEIMFVEPMTVPSYTASVFVHRDNTQLYSDLGSTVGSPQNSVTMALPPRTWFCLVWKVVPSVTKTGSLGLSGDMIPPLTLDNIQTIGVQPIRKLSFGMQFADTNVDVTQPALDLWLDDVIVHTAPVTCDD